MAHGKMLFENWNRKSQEGDEMVREIEKLRVKIED